MNSDSNTIEFREKNPMCIFCKYSYTKFFHTWCSKKNDCRGLCAKKCEHYSPTLEPIDKRGRM